jgi:Fe2+ transport system protein FeoA
MRSRSSGSISEAGGAPRLSSLRPGERGVVRRVLPDQNGRAERLAALGVTPGAPVEVLQIFPGVVFRCDETELAIEPAVARAILVDVL